MGFLSWVGDHLKRVASTPAAVLDALHRVSVVLWHVLTGLGTVVRTAWGLMLTGAKDASYWLTQLAAATYGKLRELITVTLPHLTTAILAAAWRRAAGAVDAVKTWARSAVAVATRYAKRLVDDLRGWAQSSVRWLTQHLADAVNRLGRIERKVFSLLDTPEHLAAWVFGSLWGYTWRYLRRGEVAIARWLLRAAVAETMRAVPEIEAVIAEIF